MNIVLKVENVAKYFGGIRALDGVTLDIYENELLAIIGPNGAGKTTLFNVITGLLKPDKGRILFFGKDITKLPPERRAQLGIARAFQIPKLISSASVIDNVILSCLFGGKMNLNTARNRSLKVLEMVGLDRKAYETTGNLTSPEKKLLELARAVAMRPRVLLLDEIVAGMPPVEVDNILSLVKKISTEEKITAVAMVEHVVRAVRYADRAVFMHQGKILLEGSPNDLLNNKLVRDVYLGEIVE
jgi:branched-chain amino acid transport system ATP-binding protein